MPILFLVIYFFASILAMLLWPNKDVTQKNVALFFAGGFLGLVATLLLVLLLPLLGSYLYVVFPLMAISLSCTLVVLFDVIEHESQRSLFYRIPYSVIFSSLAANFFALFWVELFNQVLFKQPFGLGFMMAYLSTPLMLILTVNLACSRPFVKIKHYLFSLMLLPLALILGLIQWQLAVMVAVWLVIAPLSWFVIMAYRQKALIESDVM